MLVGTSLLLWSLGPAFPAPRSAADSQQSHILPNDRGGQARAQPSPGLSLLPRSSRWASCGGTGRTHPLPKESPPGNTAELLRRPRHPTSPTLGMCLPERPCPPPRCSQRGTAGHRITHRARGLWSMYNHHPPKELLAGVVEMPPQGLPSRTRIRLPHASPISAGNLRPPSTPPCPLHWHTPQGRPWPLGLQRAQKAAGGGPSVRAAACMCARQGGGSRAGSAGGVVSARHRLTGKRCCSRRKFNCFTTVTIAASGSLQSDPTCWGERGQSAPRG